MQTSAATDPDYAPGSFNAFDHAAKMKAGYHFTIDTRGRWYCHDPNMAQGPLQRKSLAQLFADKGLKRDENGQYWLSSAEDSYAVAVEDTPFTITHADIREDDQGRQTIDLYTNFGAHVPLDGAHMLTLSPLPQDPDTQIPYVTLDNGLPARLSRRVFYTLAEAALEPVGDNPSDPLTIESGGVAHVLGAVHQE